MTIQETEWKNRITNLFEAAELPLSDVAKERFLTYYELLVERNSVMNLTAITEPEDVFVKHFLDSAILWKYAGEIRSDLFSECGSAAAEPLSVIDVGTGAGFPGLPLKIVRPEISLTLLDALNKRIGFLNEVRDALSLPDVRTIHARSEDAGKEGGVLRERFDLAVSRAVSALPVLAEYCLPFVRQGGYFVAYKAGDVQEEIKSAEHALGILGGVLEQVISYTLPTTDIGRSLLIIRKDRETPGQYPRKAGKPEKKPL